MLTTNIEIEVRHLRYVVTAAEQGSFRKASTKLGVRESTISRQIRDLEDALGSSLFIRRSSGVLLTQAGESFVERAQCALTQIEYAICDVGAIGRGGHGVIRIGLLSSLATGFVANLIERYSKHHKEVQLEFLEADHAELIPAIRRHQLDMAFITEPLQIEDFSSIRLWTEQVYVILSKHDLLASRSEIVWDDIRQRRFVVTEVAPGREVEALLVRNLSSLGYRPHILRDRVSRQTLMQLVACGRGITLASESVIEAQFPGVVYRPLSGCSLPFCGIWLDENDNPAFRRLLSVANTLSKARGGLARSDSRTS
ncbi:LysR family transcriptional regulator [Labrys wisconsinensis]|uniref:DNA-binding transcriptional LysR family regulator n=1 Tax=Labrys wisconsinensis TaxID=425677 RepID=A0ABU0J758_9HYPH|nr:LysR substrate-binding domain-containing protein [Labrys wisconsinensis]MDQ0470110.1 DNA-binding transcriptional LysR family regulator [Labrys wisconsinensis]